MKRRLGSPRNCAPGRAPPAKPLKSETSGTSIPILPELAAMLSAQVAVFGAETLLTDRLGRQPVPWTLERAVWAARANVDGLPKGFRFHDLRHYLALLLIASGADVKGGAGAAPAGQRQDDARHLGSPVARPR